MCTRSAGLAGAAVGLTESLSLSAGKAASSPALLVTYGVPRCDARRLAPGRVIAVGGDPGGDGGQGVLHDAAASPNTPGTRSAAAHSDGDRTPRSTPPTPPPGHRPPRTHPSTPVRSEPDPTAPPSTTPAPPSPPAPVSRTTRPHSWPSTARCPPNRHQTSSHRPNPPPPSTPPAASPSRNDPCG